MPRSTAHPDEVRHLAGFPEALGKVIGKRTRVFLKDGRQLDGIISSTTNGNNAGAGGHWEYYGGVVISTDTGDVEVDYLDVTVMIPVQISN